MQNIKNRTDYWDGGEEIGMGQLVWAGKNLSVFAFKKRIYFKGGLDWQL